MKKARIHGATGAGSSMLEQSSSVLSKSGAKFLKFDKSQIIFSASKGETGNQQVDGDISLLGGEPEQELILTEFDMSADFPKPSTTARPKHRRSEPATKTAKLVSRRL